MNAFSIFGQLSSFGVHSWLYFYIIIPPVKFAVHAFYPFALELSPERITLNGIFCDVAFCCHWTLALPETERVYCQKVGNMSKTTATGAMEDHLWDAWMWKDIIIGERNSKIDWGWKEGHMPMFHRQSKEYEKLWER